MNKTRGYRITPKGDDRKAVAILMADELRQDDSTWTLLRDGWVVGQVWKDAGDLESLDEWRARTERRKGGHA